MYSRLHNDIVLPEDILPNQLLSLSGQDTPEEKYVQHVSSRFELRLDVIERYLIPASILYLVLPYLVFCFGWLLWYWALLGTGLLTLALIECTRLISHSVTETGTQPQASPLLPSRHLLFLLSTSVVWLGLAGVGGIGYQRGDWLKHESVLKDLIEYGWPVLYDFYESPVPLVYYIAYYLPAALIGKIGGWEWAQAALFVWTYLGLLLAMLLFWLLVCKATYTQSHRVSHYIFLIFVFFSGLDVVGKLIVEGMNWSPTAWARLEKFGLNYEYSANTMLLYWVPNQALAGWMAMGVAIYAILYLRHRRVSWLPLGLSTLGTPFVTFGMMPYMLTEALTDEGPFLVRLRRYLTWSNLCGLFFLLVVGLYYLSKFYKISPYLHASLPHAFVNPFQSTERFGVLVTFWLMEVGIYAFLIRKSVISEGKLWKWLFITTVAYLVLLPLYQAGMYNDLVMRASIPALFCLAVFVTRTIFRNTLSIPAKVALVVALILGSVTSIVEVGQHVNGILRDMQGLPNEQLLVDTRGIVAFYAGMPEHLIQYVGSYESPFFQYVARPQEWTSRTKGRHYISFANNRILFEDYALDKDTALTPGDQVRLISRLHIFFDAIQKNYSISYRLVGEDGAEIWREQGYPENRPTSIWAPSVLQHDTRMITIPEDTTPGYYRLDLSFVDPDTHDLLPATAMPEQRYLGEVIPIGYVTVGENESHPGSSFVHPPRLDAKVAIAGMTPSPEQVASRVYSPGESIDLQLYWQTIGEMDRDYTGFVHLLAPDGHIVAQQDHRPRNGFLPTSIWSDGMVISDHYSILVPQDVPPGIYTLVSGMYDLETGVRLPVSQDGTASGDSFTISQLEVQ